MGFVLDSKLEFNQDIDDNINRYKLIIGIKKRFLMALSRKSLLTIHKSFDRPLLNYADIIYDTLVNESFKRKLETVQYNASLVITGAIRETSL